MCCFKVFGLLSVSRYLASFLSVRETVPQAFRLLGQIEEAVGNKENAVEAYKRFLEMGGPNKDVVLKICELYGDIGVDAGKGKYWLEKAEQLYPQSDVIFRLKEKLITASPGQSSDGDLETLITAELLKKPQDVDLRIKLLRLYLDSQRVEEAYTNAVETDRTTAFTSCLEWYECLLDVFNAYQSEHDTHQDLEFMFHYLVVLCNLTYLRLADKDVVESAEALHSFDMAVQKAINLNNPTEQWDAFVTEMQGQLFFLAGTLLLKRAQKGSVSWTDMRPLAAVLFLLCQTIPTVDAQAIWFVRPTQDREKLYAWLYNNSFFRMSQSGHTLYHLCQGETGAWGHRLQQQCCTPIGQERLYEALFPIRDMRSGSSESYLMNTHKFCNTSLSMPPRRQLYDVDRVAHTFHPNRLSEMVWLCLQQYSFGDAHQPDYNFKTFETLQYSVKNMENGAAETLCQLDTEAFLYATVRCAALQLKEQQMSVDGDVSRPPMLPLCLCKKLCTPEQEQWWKTAYCFYSNTIKENFSKMRHILQRGIEVIRLVGNHGLSSAMVVHLAKTFDAKRRPCRARMSREELVKSLAEGDHGNRGSVNQVACLESRAAFYWRQGLSMLSRLEKHQRGPLIKVRLFDDGDDADLTPTATQEMVQDAKFASATIAMREGRYEDAVRGFERLTTPYASFYRAQIYKSMAQRELEGAGPEETKRQKYTALIAQAREALYLTMDHLGGNKNHELNILLTRELDDVESKLNCFEWENENSQRDDLEETMSVMKTPVKHQNGHHSTLNQAHSTPKSPSHSKAVRQRLLLSELTTDSSIQSQPAPVSSPSAQHTRPSPERLDAQIKSINYSQSQLFKMVLDRNEELVVMYRGLVDQLQESNAQLKAALGENHTLMEELKGVLTTSKDSMATMKMDLADTKDAVRQLKDEFQANVAAAAAAAAASNASMLNAQGLAASQMNAAGYFMGSPYHPSQYPPYAQAPHLAPGAGYRYPLLPGYPPRPTTPVAPPAAPAATARLSGTVPSSFGKFRGSDHQSAAEVITTTEDEEDDEENGLSVCGSEYGESLLQTPGAQYYVPASDGTVVPDWMPGSHHSTGGMAYPAANQAPAPQPPVPQPGYFASALKGQALQYSAASMPGPGFFSSPTAATVGMSTQSAIVTALGAKAGVGQMVGQQPTPPPPVPQPIPVIGTGASKSPQPTFPATKAAESQGVVILFQDNAKLTTSNGDIPAVDVRIIQDTVSKQGSIVVRKKDTQEILTSHNIAIIRVVHSFTPNYFLWSIASAGEKKLEETFRLTFDSVDQAKKLRGAIELVVKSAGIKPPVSPATPVTPAFGTKSPGAQSSPHTMAVVSTPAAVVKPPAPQSATTSTATPATQGPGAGKATFGGFTFTSTPVIKPADTQAENTEKPKASPHQFKLKESTIKVPTPPAPVSTTTTSTIAAPTTTATSSEPNKPFAGFTFTPSRPAASSAFGSAGVTSSMVASISGSGSSGTSQGFVFGHGSTTSPSFASLSSQSTSEAFRPKEGGSSFQASPRPLFTKGSSPLKSPGGEDGMEEYEPNVDFKPIIDLPDLVEIKTGEEGETKVFSDRVKLFRFDSETSQWKERGIGELKILRSVGVAPRFRVIMRREQVLKVCANHYISTDMKLTPLSASDRAWCYTAHDFAEEEMKIERFAVKFKNPDKAGEFRTTFENCQKEITAGEAATESAAAAAAAAPTQKSDKTDGTKSLAEMFKPEEGSWECPACYINNKANVQSCVACQSLKPGLSEDDAKPSAKGSPFSSATTRAPAGTFGGFKFGGDAGTQKSMFGSSSGGVSVGGFKFGGAPAPPAATSAPAAAPAAEQKDKQQSLAEMFKPEEGSWECAGCYINNKADVQRCVACQSLKPGLSKDDVKSSTKESPFSSGAPAGTFGGFKFGTSASTGNESMPAPAPVSAGFKFGAAPLAAGEETGGFKFGTSTKPPEPAATTPGGFKFSFGTPTTSAFVPQSTASTSVASSTAPLFGTSMAATASDTTSATTSTPSTGFVFGGSKPPVFGTGASAAKDNAGKDSGFSFAKPQAMTAAPPTEQSEPCSGLLQQLLTTEDQPERIQKPEQSAFGSGAADPKPSGFQAKLGQMTSPTKVTDKDGTPKAGFQFTFSLQKQQQASQQPTSPKSPEVDEQGFYLNKEGEDSHIYFEPVIALPEKIDMKTGEEEEEVLFESRAKLYRFISGEWKERGLGVVKILQHKDTGRIRLLMRRDQVLKICCNHFITEELDLKPMPRSDGKAWIWYAMDFTDGTGKMEQFAIRFRDADIANNFKKVFDESREKMKTPSKSDSKLMDPTVVNSGGKSEVARRLFHAPEGDDDVVFVYEETPTPDQLARARKLLLPDTFYLYENRPGCPGCRGCEDYDPSKSPSVPKAEKSKTITPTSAMPTQAVKEPVREETIQKASEGKIFGADSDMSFSALAATSGDTPGFGPKDPSKPFHWAGAGQRLFGSGGGGEEEGEEGEVAPSDDIHFEPVIPLPELVEVKTGEEDWTALFVQRAKVYRFDGTQWKERGIGEMKIMKHVSRLLFRVLLRREQVLKVACNHLISPTMELKPMATSETAWCWVATDYSDNDAKLEQLAVKFKKVEVAKEFKAVFEDCQEKLRQGEPNEPVQETMVSSSAHPTGDRGNVRHTEAIDVSVHDTMASSIQPECGDKGNPYYTQKLNMSGQDNAVSSSQPAMADQGNLYFKAPNAAAQEAQISSTTFQVPGGGGNPLFSQLLSPEEAEAEEQYDDEDYDDDDEDDDDEDESTEEEDEEERVEFEKRVTLFRKGDADQWQKVGMGNLRVLYDDDLNANKLVMVTDNAEKACNHVITMELTVAVDEKKKSCEWQPIDFATDEPIRRHFKAYFSSLQATEEFATIFRQGQKLAAESEISAKLPEEIEVPEVFSTGDRSESAAGKK